LNSLLKKYDRENLDKINVELEHNKASRHDLLIGEIDKYQLNAHKYAKEP
jgi:hypothetical protein